MPTANVWFSFGPRDKPVALTHLRAISRLIIESAGIVDIVIAKADHKIGIIDQVVTIHVANAEITDLNIGLYKE